MKDEQVKHQNRRQVAQWLALAGLGVASTSLSRAQTSVGKLVYGIGNLDAMFAAGFVALKNGYFRAAGLDASFVDCQNGPRARQMLAAGQVNIVASASFDPMVVNVAGKRTRIIAGIDQRLPYANVVVRKEDVDSGRIKSFADLAGKRIGVSGPKSAFWLMATQMVESGNLKGVEIRGIGDTVAMLAALKSKQVDASMATISMMEAAEREGWGVPLVSINEPEVWRRTIGLGGDVQGQWIYGLEDYIRSNPAIVQAFVTGWVRGHDFVMSNKTETVVDLIYSDFLSPFKRDTVAQAVSVLKEKVWSADNMITADAYRRVVSIMSGDKLVSDAEAARFPYDGAVDMSFVRKARNR
jgi:NitT/TauT family transport system substrate-binding protein